MNRRDLLAAVGAAAVGGVAVAEDDKKAADPWVYNGPSPTIWKPPVRECYIHGLHTAWVQFRWTELGEHPDHYCMKCLLDHINKMGIGRAPDQST